MTVISFFVIVPVLSVQITEILPIDSIADKFRIITPVFAKLSTPVSITSVVKIGRFIGITFIDLIIAAINSPLIFSEVKISSSANTLNLYITKIERFINTIITNHLAKLFIFLVNGISSILPISFKV